MQKGSGQRYSQRADHKSGDSHHIQIETNIHRGGRHNPVEDAGRGRSSNSHQKSEGRVTKPLYPCSCKEFVVDKEDYEEYLHSNKVGQNDQKPIKTKVFLNVYA